MKFIKLIHYNVYDAGDIVKVVDSKVKVTDNSFRKCTFPAEVYQLTVLRRRPSSFISERELKFMFAICHRRSVCCLSSVTLVRPTQTIEIFHNVSTP